ncbi:MAG: hypothetical protein HKM07_01625 [Chlamydiae bacterium]|nr:hypothetical protein [Chlamydiota bacterium]
MKSSFIHPAAEKSGDRRKGDSERGKPKLDSGKRWKMECHFAILLLRIS